MTFKRAAPPATPNVVTGGLEPDADDTSAPSTGRVTLRLPEALLANFDQLEGRLEVYKSRYERYEPVDLRQKRWTISPEEHQWVKDQAEHAGLTVNGFIERILEDKRLAPLPKAKITYTDSLDEAVKRMMAKRVYFVNSDGKEVEIPVDGLKIDNKISQTGIISADEAREALTVNLRDPEPTFITAPFAKGPVADVIEVSIGNTSNKVYIHWTEGPVAAYVKPENAYLPEGLPIGTIAIVEDPLRKTVPQLWVKFREPVPGDLSHVVMLPNSNKYFRIVDDVNLKYLVCNQRLRASFVTRNGDWVPAGTVTMTLR